MITPDDNGYGRVKKWREKNRALYNLQQRNYRKKKKGGDAPCREIGETQMDQSLASNAAPTVRPTSAARSKIEELRELVRIESERVVEEPVRPLIYRNDFGGVITKTQWEKLQEKKRLAKEGGYTLDEYSQ